VGSFASVFMVPVVEPFPSKGSTGIRESTPASMDPVLFLLRLRLRFFLLLRGSYVVFAPGWPGEGSITERLCC